MSLLCHWKSAILAATALIAAASASATAAETTKTDFAALAFRDAVTKPPAGWTGPVFTLRHDYPAEQPTCPAPWLERKVSFDDPSSTAEEWKAYLQDVIDYAWEGQHPDLPDETGWKTEVDGKARWYHVPWMAYDGQRGREFAHGLTNELSTAKSIFLGDGRGSGKHGLGLDPKDDDPLFETWSVGMYNPCGAWSIGQAVPSSGVPATYTKDDRNFAKGMPFPAGSVVIKLLNTTATAEDVPYLKGSTNWTADGHTQISPTEYATCERTPRKVHLVQMDLAVVDPRSPTRWVYATLAYDGTQKGKTVRSRMMPVGIQWGNDPKTFPAVPEAESEPARESILPAMNIPQHYGCNMRLAGVVDQRNSSCTSCHMGAYSAPVGEMSVQGQNIPAIFHFNDMCTAYNADNKHYFSNYQYPAPYPSGQFPKAIPLDSSLQLAVAFQEYATALNPPAQPTCPPAGQ